MSHSGRDDDSNRLVRSLQACPLPSLVRKDEKTDFRRQITSALGLFGIQKYAHCKNRTNHLDHLADDRYNTDQAMIMMSCAVLPILPVCQRRARLTSSAVQCHECLVSALVDGYRETETIQHAYACRVCVLARNLYLGFKATRHGFQRETSATKVCVHVEKVPPEHNKQSSSNLPPGEVWDRPFFLYPTARLFRCVFCGNTVSTCRHPA